MGIPLELSFVTFTCLGAVLFAASSAGTLAGWSRSVLLSVTIVALAAMLLSMASVTLYLGHPERIFGALFNINSVFSRELIIVIIGIVLMAIFAYRLYTELPVTKPLSVVSIAVAVAILVCTGQLVYFWASHHIMVRGIGAGT
jgi:hypothetical protein